MDELYLRLAALARRFGAKRLVLFGSRARGDNRPNSADSRRDYVGQIREKDVKGELLFRLGNLSGLEKDIRRLQFKARRMFSGQF